MKLNKFFDLVFLFSFIFFNIKCIQSISLKTPGLYFKNDIFYTNRNNNTYGFIGFSKKDYSFPNLNKTKVNSNKDILKKFNRMNVLYSQDSEYGLREYKNDKSLWKRFVNKMSEVNKNVLTKLVCAGTFCLALYPVYTMLLNSKIEYLIKNILKENFLYLNIPKSIKRYLFFISFAEFKRSPFFLSTMLIASYTLYVILKVYIEKYRESKRIKSAIEDYNKNKNEYINTGTDSSTENDMDYYNNMDDDDYNKDFY
ncbi:conserved Plasmodium protein, unknown function [Plasmodium reichenowi]|uniref:Uncharacterized protein n=1 Tax=Plasmodium reichenowi TaxID=5854 RepID=A0A060RZV1_PLARE|nr:hypothetical protein PRSY57_1121100 [Plasmodium reichenowi]KYN96560.1 hypothetical protein PRSY57_1121100 [Plasmodium reichenowi]CDO65030.1 conserved Plasmodium protein, unknown function [Plasmodium reichenowi]SOS79264.1 conserved Plasmodium protein, unknown function, putative [Plasmodium sp. gorilla clade G1]SOV80157.1 conserved Plasmodium protein, unknown function [Plasmodium reichenowi]